MKKNLFIYAALCALVAAGCSKQDEAETLQPEQGEALHITISATRHEAPSTRTEYEEDYDGNKLIVKWNSDRSDKLGVFTKDNGTTSNTPFNVDGALSADGKTAHFTGSLNVLIPSQETTVYGYYPYSSEAVGTSESIHIDLSGQQQDGISGEASLAHLATKDYLAATVTKKLSNGDQNLSLVFTPLLTIMSFKITKAMNVASIKLEAAGTTNLTPFYTEGTVNITDKTFPISPGGTAQSSVKLDVAGGAIDADANGMFNMMIFPIIADNMPTQFKATVTTTTGDIYEQTKLVPEGGFFERGKRYIMVLDKLTIKDDKVWDGNMPTANDSYAYSGGDGISNPYQIATANDLAQLAANVNAGFDASNSFILTKNINLNGKEWTPIGKEGANFKGTFDGGSKTITSMKITIPKKHIGLFGYANEATIKNINVAGEINIGTTDIGVINAGGILGEGYRATLSGITNHVNITIKDEGSSLTIGGVAGLIAGKAVADAKLTNDGILNINGKGGVNVGGVIGYITSDIQSGTTLINSGAVSGTSSGSECIVGGLISYSGGAVSFNGTNSGSVRGKITGGFSNVYCGGFIGYTTKAVTIESTLNTGAVTAENSCTIPDANSYAGIRVGGAMSSINLEEANNNADGTAGSIVGITATAINGNKSYVNGVETITTP